MKNLLLFTTRMNRVYLTVSYMVIMLLMSINGWAIPPSIINQPTGVTVCQGGAANYAITAANATSYQWQQHNGIGWSNISNGGMYSGALTNFLTVAGVTPAMTGYQYRCIATGPDNPPATSNAASLTVNTTVTINTQPTAFTTICSGGNASFTVGATSTVPITYTWHVHDGTSWSVVTNGGIYSGATTNTLTITGITAGPSAKTYLYYCAASGSCGGVASAQANLTVNAPTVITTQPSNTTVCSGNNASFTINATGTNLTYQWQRSFNGIAWTTLVNDATYSAVTTNTLVVASNPTLDASQYRCVVSGACTSPQTSNPGILTVNSPLQIVTQPNFETLCPGGSVVLSVTATGLALTYQWQVNTGSGWSNVVNGGVYSNAGTRQLSLTNVPLSFNQNQYRCVVNGTCSPTTISSPSILTVNTPLAISVQPVAATTICSGSNASFSVGATGTGPYTYQWYLSTGSGFNPISNGGVYSGATSSTLNITGITAAPSTQTFFYFCAVGGACGSQSSGQAVLTVNALPVITSQPSNSTVCSGNNAAFSITATGTGLTYQWQRSFNGVNWVNLSNDAIYSAVNTNTLVVTTNPTVDASQYRCIVNGTCTPSQTSGVGNLTVIPPLQIVTQPNVETLCPGGGVVLSVTATGLALTYQWQVNTGSGWNNVVNGGVYSNAGTRQLSLTNVPLSFNQNQYRCVVNGTCSPTTISNSVILTVNTPLAISVQPAASTTICSGGNTSFTTAVTGTGPYTYQWYVSTGSGFTAVSNGGIYSGATASTLNITGITAAPSAQVFSYFCAINGPCGGISSGQATLTVNALPAIAVQPQNDTVCTGTLAEFEITATGTNTTYQWQVSTNNGGSWSNLSNNATYSGVTVNEMVVTTNTGLHNNLYRCVVSGICAPAANSNGARLIIDTPPAVTIHPSNSTICNGNNTLFSVTATGTGLTYQWQVNNGSGWSNISNVGIYSNATTATLNLTGATTTVHSFRYRCIINGVCTPSAISNEATLNINTAPAVTVQPISTNICPGGNASFSITATGAGLTYQWEVNNGLGWTSLSNGGIYSNVTTATLNLTGATAAVNGFQYRCVVNGTCFPATTSNAAILTINTLPAVSVHPMNSTICLNGNTSFSVTATGTGLAYQWQSSVNGIAWSSLSNSTTYAGVTTNTLSITSAQSNLNGILYRCVVSGTCSPSVNSNSGLLTVNNPTAITNNPVNATICQNANTGFTVTATGTGLTYQWQVNTGSGFSDISNGGVYSGATTNGLTLTNVPTSFNTYQYRCVVNGVCAPLVLNSTTATLTVNSNIVINTQPTATMTLCSGANTSLTVGATGTGIAYQWYVHNGTSYVPVTNTGIYSGATTATLTITGITAAPSARVYDYYCVMTGTCIGANSNHSYITVNALPAVTTNPSNVVVCDSSDNIVFNTAATGTNVTYQWQVNTGSSWVNLSNNSNTSGVTTNQLLLSKAYYSMNGYQYRCVATGICAPSATSNAATLTVNPLVTPSVSIAVNNNNICAGTLVTFTATPVNGGAASYQWKRNGVNIGGNSATLNTSVLANNDIVRVEMTSNATCPSPKIAHSNQITMSVTSYQLPTVVVTSSSGNTECSGIPVTFTTATTFAGTTPTYQWQVNGINVGSTASSYVTDSLDNGDVVRCIMTSSFQCPSLSVVSSNNVSMTINQTTPATVSIRTNPDTTVCRGAEVILYSYYTNSGINPQFQWIKNGVNLPGETGATYTTTTLNNNDVVRCRFISSALCVFPVVSDTLRFKVDNPVTPSVNVKVSFNGGNSYTFTATPVNGGTAPVYTWFVNGSPVGGVTGATYTTSLLTPASNVYVTMTSNHPCITTDVANSRIVTTGIGGQEEVLSDLKLYPNPNTGRFTISGDYAGIGTQNARITILNALGQVIYTSDLKVVSGKINHEINLNNEPASGMYMMRIDMEGRQDIRRFSIAK